MKVAELIKQLKRIKNHDKQVRLLVSPSVSQDGLPVVKAEELICLNDYPEYVELKDIPF